MRKYYPRILNFVYRFLGNRQLAEDLTQESFMKVYKSARRYRPRSKFQTWLYTIARNTCLNEVRRNRGRMVSLDEPIMSNECVLKKEISDPNADPAREFLQKEKETPIRGGLCICARSVNRYFCKKGRAQKKAVRREYLVL